MTSLPTYLIDGLKRISCFKCFMQFFNPSVPAGHLPFQERLKTSEALLLKPPLVRGGGAEHRRGF